jgi:hypothetical protein
MQITAATDFKPDGLTLDQLNADPYAERHQMYGNPDEDSKLHVRFYMETVEQTAMSILAGHRKVADTEFIEIMMPGDKHNIIRRQVFDMDRIRFAQHYAKFKQGLVDQTIGTPLSELIFLTAAKVKEYEFFNIRTVEQLAATPESSDAGQKMMGFSGDKQKAAAFLEIAKGMVPLNELRQKIEEKDQMVELMKRQLDDMNSRLEKATAKAK